MEKTHEPSNFLPIIAIALAIISIGLYFNLNSNIENIKKTTANEISQSDAIASNSVPRSEYDNKMANMDKYRICINRAVRAGVECVESKTSNPDQGTSGLMPANACGVGLYEGINNCDKLYWPNTG